MKLQDYIHYYMGATYWTDNSQGEVNKVTLQHIYPMIEKRKNVQLHLRRMEDMTEEEKTHIGKLAGWYEGKKIINDHHLEVAHDTMKEMAYDCLITANDNEGDRLGPAAYFSFMPYLLRQGFDLFGLIDGGLAIDIKTI